MPRMTAAQRYLHRKYRQAVRARQQAEQLEQRRLLDERYRQIGDHPNDWVLTVERHNVAPKTTLGRVVEERGRPGGGGVDGHG